MARSLLIEEVDLQSIEQVILVEKATKEKKYIIKGPFMEANIKNKNKRIYPSPIIRPEVEKYQKAIKEMRSAGELNHPKTLEIDPKNISHRTTKLAFDGDNIVLGEAQISSSPNGMIVRALMDDGFKLGVSSRGAGTLKDGIVQKDFKYVCNDIVWEPSASSAFVESIMEAKTEWVLEEGILVEKDLEDYKNRLANYKKGDVNKVLLGIFEDMLNKVSN